MFVFVPIDFRIIITVLGKLLICASLQLGKNGQLHNQIEVAISFLPFKNYF